MKITQSQLRQIIREEVSRSLLVENIPKIKFVWHDKLPSKSYVMLDNGTKIPPLDVGMTHDFPTGKTTPAEWDKQEGKYGWPSVSIEIDGNHYEYDGQNPDGQDVTDEMKKRR